RALTFTAPDPLLLPEASFGPVLFLFLLLVLLLLLLLPGCLLPALSHSPTAGGGAAHPLPSAGTATGSLAQSSFTAGTAVESLAQSSFGTATLAELSVFQSPDASTGGPAG